eukprot:PhF_6_TR25801/c0_g1_i1/m.36408
MSVRRPRNPGYNSAATSPRAGGGGGGTATSFIGSEAHHYHASQSRTPGPGHTSPYHHHSSSTNHHGGDEASLLRQQVITLSEQLQSLTVEMERERAEWHAKAARESTQYRTRREAMSTITEELRQQCATLTGQADTHREENERLRHEIKTLQQTMKQLEESLSKSRSEVMQVTGNKDDVSRSMEATRSELTSWRQRATTAENLVLDMKNEMSRCRAESETSKNMYDRLKQQFDTMCVELQRSRENEERLHQSVSEATHFLKDANQIRKEHCEMVQKCGELTQAVATLKMEKEFLVKHMGEGIADRDRTIAKLRQGNLTGSSSDDNARQMLMENTQLRESLREAIHGIELERSTTAEYTSVLLQRAEVAEASSNTLQSELEQLKVEYMKLKAERNSLEDERRKAVTLRDELEKTLVEVRSMRF